MTLNILSEYSGQSGLWLFCSHMTKILSFLFIYTTDAAPTFSSPVDGAACTVASIAEGSTGTTVTDTIVTAAATGTGTITFILVVAHADTPQFTMTGSDVTLKTTATVDYDAPANKYLTVQIE